MCRFVAYVGAPIAASRVVFGGEHSLYEQSWAPEELLSGSVNADGYGVVWYHRNRPARLAEARPVWYDPELRTTLDVIESPCVVAALRNGTEGLLVDRAGLLPLVHDRWCFVLNGFVPDFHRAHMRALRASLPDDLYGALRGSSDSETLFLLVLATLRAGGSMQDALARTVDVVRERVGKAEAQLNMLLSDGNALAAVRGGTEPVTNSLYVAEGPAFAPEGVVIASEPPERDAGWAPVDGHSWIRAERSGTVRGDPFFPI